MEYSPTSPFLLLRSKMYVSLYRLGAGAVCRHRTNEWNFGTKNNVGLPLVCLSIISVISIICRLALFRFSYVGLVMCRHQRPPLDLTTVFNPASWLSKSKLRRLLAHEKRLRKIELSELTFVLFQIKIDISDGYMSKFQSLSIVCLVKQPWDSYEHRKR
jgi:hypothetical protein